MGLFELDQVPAIRHAHRAAAAVSIRSIAYKERSVSTKDAGAEDAPDCISKE